MTAYVRVGTKEKRAAPDEPAPDLPLDQIIEDDCIAAMARLPDGCVDMVFADPPYNLQLGGDLFRPEGGLVDAVDDDWDKFATFADYDEFTRAWLKEARRILKPNGTLWVIGSYHNIYRVGAALQDAGLLDPQRHRLAQVEPDAEFPRHPLHQRARDPDLGARSEDSRYTFNYRAMKALNDELQMRSDWLLPICSGGERVEGRTAPRPTRPRSRKPCSTGCCSPAPTPATSCSTRSSAPAPPARSRARLGRHWIGIEREKRYVKVARERIASTLAARRERDARRCRRSARSRRCRSAPWSRPA